MARPKEGNYNQTNLNLDPQEFEEFSNNLPKHQSPSEIIRQFIHDENERIRREKKDKPLAKGALINFTTDSNKKLRDRQNQTTLDIFAKEKPTELSKLFDELKESGDIPMIRNFTRNCQIGYDMGRTYFRSKK